jgi:hypothetical protein
VVVYEVNLTLDADIASEFQEWLAGHVTEMLEFKGFESSKILDVEDAFAKRLCVWYFVETRADLEAYFEEGAARMRADGLDRFGGRFQATRRILAVEDDRKIS